MLLQLVLVLTFASFIDSQSVGASTCADLKCVKGTKCFMVISNCTDKEICLREPQCQTPASCRNMRCKRRKERCGLFVPKDNPEGPPMAKCYRKRCRFLKCKKTEICTRIPWPNSNLAHFLVPTCIDVCRYKACPPGTTCVAKRRKGKGVCRKLRTRDFTSEGCATPLQAVNDTIFGLNATQPSSFPDDGFCRVYARKDLGAVNYSISVDLFNVIGRGSPQFGHLGIFYNAKDINNYDFAYLRQHFVSHCYQTGQVINGTIDFTGWKSSTCANGVPPGGQWYNMEVVVNGTSAYVYRDGVFIATHVYHFPIRASGGMLVGNGYTNLGYFRNFNIS